jgi:hypothetical protein
LGLRWPNLVSCPPLLKPSWRVVPTFPFPIIAIFKISASNSGVLWGLYSGCDCMLIQQMLLWETKGSKTGILKNFSKVTVMSFGHGSLIQHASMRL